MVENLSWEFDRKPQSLVFYCVSLPDTYKWNCTSDGYWTKRSWVLASIISMIGLAIKLEKAIKFHKAIRNSLI